MTLLKWKIDRASEGRRRAKKVQAFDVKQAVRAPLGVL